MPIDFNAVSSQFAGALTAQSTRIGSLFEDLEKAVKDLAEQATKGDRATRGYPVLRYYDEALCVHVDTPGGPLLQAPGRLGAVDGLRAGFADFAGGVRWPRVAVEQELALPRLLDVGARTLEAVGRSVDRFARPSVSMFEALEGHLEDIPGVLVLAYNSLVGPQDAKQLVGFGRDIGLATAPLPGTRTTTPAHDEADGTARLVGLLDTTTSQFADLVLILPILTDLIAVGLHDGTARLKRSILTAVEGLETTAYDLRAKALDKFVAGTGFGELAVDVLATARAFALTNIAILTDVYPWLLDGMLRSINAFAAGISAWGTWFTDVIQRFAQVVDLNDLRNRIEEVVRSVMGDWLYDRMGHLPMFDLPGSSLPGSWVRNPVRRARYRGQVWVTENVVARVSQRRAEQIRAADYVHTLLFVQRYPHLPADPKKPSFVGFPDAYETTFGEGRREQLLGGIHTLVGELKARVGGMLSDTRKTVDDLGTTIADAANRTAEVGSSATLRGIAQRADGTVEAVFGSEVSETLAHSVQRRGSDTLAGAYEAAFVAAVAAGGLSFTGAVVPAYVGELRAYWASHQSRDAPPTSPHILAKRGYLAGVSVPRLTVDVADRMPDGPLAALVGERFHGAMAKAHADGRAKFERIAAGTGHGSHHTRTRPAPSRGARPTPALAGGGRMADSDEIVTQMGLLLTQVGYARGALEQIERATSKYAGIALKIPGDGEAGPLGAPPLVGGALKVYIVNIDDLTSSGGGIGDVIAGAIGGAGRFLGGLVGGFVGGTIGSISFPWIIASLSKCVAALDRILARIGTDPAAPEPKTDADRDAVARRTPGLQSQIPALVETLRAAAAAFTAAAGRSTSGAGGAVAAGAPGATGATTAYLELVKAIGVVVKGLTLVVPTLGGALASLLIRLDDIKLAILDTMQFALRNVLLLWGTLTAIVGQTLPLAATLVSDVVGIVGSAVSGVITSIGTVISSSLETAMLALDISGKGLKGTVDSLMTWLEKGLGAALTFLGKLKIFELVAHLVNVMPHLIPAIATVLGKTVSPEDAKALRAAALIPQISGPDEGAHQSTTVGNFPAFEATLVPQADREDLGRQLRGLGETMHAEWQKGEKAASDAIGAIGRRSGAVVAHFDQQLHGQLKTAGVRAAAATDSLKLIPEAATKRPQTGLELIATAYEAWLVGGGLTKVLGVMENHFGSPDASAIAKAVVKDVGDRAAAPPVLVEIDEVTIELGAAPAPVATAQAQPAAYDYDEHDENQRSRDVRRGIQTTGAMT